MKEIAGKILKKKKNRLIKKMVRKELIRSVGS